MLTPHQQRTYEFVKKFIQEHQYAPTISEIAEGVGVKSRNLIQRHLKAMAEHGHIYLRPHRRRNICLSGDGMHVPLVGTIAAGTPIEAISQNETVDLAELFLGPHRFALRVKGNSMEDDGILDGDIVVCEKCETPKSGEIVVALLDNQDATLKRFEHCGDQITLHPANKSMQPMTYPAHQVKVQGKFLGLLRVS